MTSFGDPGAKKGSTSRLRSASAARLGLVGVLAVAGCSGGARNASKSSGSLEWDSCGQGECSRLEVPVDYSEPNGEKLELALYRARAEGGTSRGVLFYFPGGPGVPIVRLAPQIQPVLSDLFPELDIVMMDQRGVGESAPIDCMGPEFLEKGSHLNVSIGRDDDIERAVGELSEFWSDFENDCRRALGARLLSNYESENVARDLDEVRKALGQNKIHVWAASYASAQAALYAKMYPSHVGGFLLDLPTYRGNNDRIEDQLQIIAAHDHELDRALRWCARENRCGLGDSVQDVYTAYDGLREQLAEGKSYDDKPIPPASLTLAMMTWIGTGAWDEMASALSAATDGDWEPVMRRARTDPYYDDERDQLAYWQSSAVLQLIDFGCPKDYTKARAVADIEKALDEYPRTAEVFVPDFAACAGWSTEPKQARIVPENVDVPPMLLVAGANDPFTPLSSARALQNQLNNDSELLVGDVEGHGVLFVNDSITDDALQFIEQSVE